MGLFFLCVDVIDDFVDDLAELVWEVPEHIRGDALNLHKNIILKIFPPRETVVK